MSFGMTDNMLLPLLDTDALMPSTFESSQALELPPVMTSAAQPRYESGPGQTFPASPQKYPPGEPMAAAVKLHAMGCTVPMTQGPCSIKRNIPPAEPQTAPRVLRSIITPAEQLRQKDETIAALNAKVHMLEAQVANHEVVMADQIAAAEKSVRAAAEVVHHSLKVAATQAEKDVEASKDHAAKREAALQARLFLYYCVPSTSC